MPDVNIQTEIEKENIEASGKSQKSNNESYREIERIENAGILAKIPADDRMKPSIKRSKELSQNPNNNGIEKITDWDRM